MEDYSSVFCEKIVHGYVKKYCNNYNENLYGMITIILMFHDKYVTFGVFNENGLKLIENCKYFRVNNKSLFFVDNKDILYVYGSNKFGNLGINNEDDMELNDITIHNNFKNGECMLISNGITNKHGFICTKNNELYGFGRNNKSQIGSQIYGRILYDVTLIDYNFDSKLKEISCGAEHTLCLTNKRNVYACGNNKFKQIPFKYGTKNVNMECVVNSRNIISIGCCYNSSYLLYSTNAFKSFGDNTYGELCDKNTLKGIKITKFNCGQNHIGCLTGDNILYMFGNNYDYQSGFDNIDVCFKGYKINISDIIDVKCGGFHTIIKTINNEYYAFGLNKNKQLLIDTNKDKLLPTLIDINYLKKITNSSNMIIDLIPGYINTYIIQQTTSNE